MDLNAPGLIPLIIVGLGILLILIGAYMSLMDWNATRANIVPGGEGVGKTLEGLAKVLEAIKDYPPGQKMIVFGIILIIIGGIWGGVASMAA